MRVLSDASAFVGFDDVERLDFDVRLYGSEASHEQWEDHVSSVQVSGFEVLGGDIDDPQGTTLGIGVYVLLVCDGNASLAWKHTCAAVDHRCLIK